MNASPKKPLQWLPLAVATWIGGALGIAGGFAVSRTAAESLPPPAGFVIGVTVAAAIGLAVGIRIYRRLCE